MRSRHRWIVMSTLRHVKGALARGDDPGEDLNDLMRMLSPTEPYVAYTRTLVRQHLGPYLHLIGL